MLDDDAQFAVSFPPTFCSVQELRPWDGATTSQGPFSLVTLSGSGVEVCLLGNFKSSCDGLNEHGPKRLMYLNAWAQVGGTA